MIHVDFDPKALTGEELREWQKWEKLAKGATSDVIAQWRNWRKGRRDKPFAPKFKPAVWSKLKTWLLEKSFRGKCAYCETKESRFDYHAEHFRPKGAVTFRAGDETKLERANCCDTNGAEVPHEGYFWLAYSWRNLLPSCAFCNTSDGKKTQFPVQKKHVGPYVSGRKPLPTEDELDAAEYPLLLHPFRDDPRKHLVFGIKGHVTAYEDSKKGKHSIEVYDLAAEKLRIRRHTAQDYARLRFLSVVAGAGADPADVGTAVDAFVGDVESEKSEYSAAVADYLRVLRRRLGG